MFLDRKDQPASTQGREAGGGQQTARRGTVCDNNTIEYDAAHTQRPHRSSGVANSEVGPGHEERRRGENALGHLLGDFLQ
jgi:hypothetical protein